MQTTQLRFHIKYLIIGLLLGLGIGFFVGRATIETEETIKIVEVPTQYGSVNFEGITPEYSKDLDLSVPVLPKLPFYIFKEIVRYDTIDNIITPVIDSAKIAQAYFRENHYDYILFDNEYGKLRIKQIIQYNMLSSTAYEFNPLQKQIYKTVKDVWQPFISGSYSTIGYVGLGGGVFYHNLGFEYQYLKGFRDTNNAHLFGLKYKF